MDRRDRLIRSGLSLAKELSLEAVLQRIVEEATELTDAQYGALGVLGPAGEIAEFVTSGVTPEQRAAIESDLKADPLVDHFVFEDKNEAYAKFKVLFASAPDLVNLTKVESLPESYRVKLKDPNTFDEFEAKYEKYVSDEGGLELILDQKKLLEKVFTVLGSLQKLALIIAVVQGVAALMIRCDAFFLIADN